MSVPEKQPATPETKKKMTPEEIELEWFKTTYQGDNMPQLTLRATVKTPPKKKKGVCIDR